MKKDETNQDAVANFLGSMDMDLDKYDHVRNASSDAKLYKWNGKTLSAILTGIRNAYGEKED
jgi:hypothetical protein